MELRIHRTFHWELDCSRSEVKIGGNNPMKLVSHDTLQWWTPTCKWIDVEVVEAEKPKHPNDLNLKRGYGNLNHSLPEDLFKSK